MTEKTESAARTKDAPSDIISITPTGHSYAKIRSNFIAAGIEDLGDNDVESGVQVHQDGSFIGLSAGTTWTAEDKPKLYTSHGITPEQAREIAEALTTAADNAEEAGVETVAEEEPSSFLRRLLP